MHPVAPSSLHSTALSVNLNKVALVRNTRHLGIPSVVRAADLCLVARVDAERDLWLLQMRSGL